MTIYLDCNASTPMDPRVWAAMRPCFESEHGDNAGSHSHEFGLHARQLVQRARAQIADLTRALAEEVLFTSGATESNNLAILGSALAQGSKKGHIVTTAIEHKAVLEPIEQLQKSGFEVTTLAVGEDGAVDPQAVHDALRTDTFLVSIIQVNNETGVRQPIAEVGEVLRGKTDAVFHVDAAQGFGKEPAPLRDDRIDLISISGHKIYGPQGIGALVVRRRTGGFPHLSPLMYGGGQERGLRPGTLPVALAVGLGEAVDIAGREHADWAAYCARVKTLGMQALGSIGAEVNGDPDRSVAHTLNVSIPGVNSEAAMLAMKGVAAVSNGSACTSAKYEPSHVLTAMGLSSARVEGALRFSWCHMTPEFEWQDIVDRLRLLV